MTRTAAGIELGRHRPDDVVNFVRAMPENSHRRAEGYPSARDLPSFAEILEQIKDMKLLTRYVAREQRAKLVELETQARDLTNTVDRFYWLLGGRHWIFHDDLNVEKVNALTTLDADTAERSFIEIYRDPASLRFMIRRLNGLPAMRSRMDLIEKARTDYEADRFYATVLVLITVMDGFVNDLEPARRRGLHTREADELAAWDSVVGHHMGLMNAHTTFTKSIYKTSSEPVYELHRHGIIHGTLLSYDNIVVATKAWNRLFAVADWARSLQDSETRLARMRWIRETPDGTPAMPNEEGTWFLYLWRPWAMFNRAASVPD